MTDELARERGSTNHASSLRSAEPAWLDREAYPFAWHDVEVPAGRMHYVDEGQGPVILFVHGTPTWSFEYRHLIRAFSGRYRCIAPDHLGFGLSDRPKAFSYTPADHAAMLAAFVERLDLTNITLVVHDFGGPIGLPLALAVPTRVDRVVILNSWMWPFDDDPAMRRKAAVASGALGRWLYRHANASLKIIMPSAYGRRQALTPAIHRQYLEVFRAPQARVDVLHALARALTGSRDFYAGLWARASRLEARPVLIIWGMKDSAFGPSFLARWRARLPHAAVVELPDAGHWPHEEAPDAVTAAIAAWLA
jgi:haloalkane dehalogenase